MRSLRWLWVWALLLAGCQLRPVAAPVPPPPASTAGHLAYIGLDGNIYVTDLTTTTAVTRDATAAPETTGTSYHRISWSRSGHLAFARVTRAGSQASSALFVVDAPGQPPHLVAENEANFVIYIYWSPRPCPNRAACQQLTYLIEEPDGSDIGLQLVEIEGSEFRREQIGRGRPFFYSWHPNGEELVWHTGGAQRRNPAAQLTLYNLAAGTRTPADVSPGLFLAPAWSPQGDRWLGVLEASQQDQLHSINGQQLTQLPAIAADNYITFDWSPQGDRLAYAVRTSRTDPVFDPIFLFDFANGETRQLTNHNFRIVAFFWSPDGEKIAYLQQPDANEDWLQWRVYNVATDTDRGYEMFVPSLQMRYVMSSFNQYAQSHRFWSPNSRYLVYADRDENLVERVWLVDTWAENSAPPRLIDTGTFGVWSWE